MQVGLSYDAGRPAGFSMSPVWLEEWETSVLAAGGWQFGTSNAGGSGIGEEEEGVEAAPFVVVELHDACASNAWRSHFQVCALSNI